ncbi:MAG: hypothetical protein KME05_12435 [Gloeocapsa sp. UFS-A4-WI-NPMV-4B04]|jgi:hypothetical protein|nr:hypothetical protein [Gloeocapsa sp. UFS-A4-WI-NPMV-4B04]
MLIQKLQLLKIPDSLEAALEYVGTERWICWYCDTSMESLIIEDINSSYFGNQTAWLLLCSFMDNNPHVEFKGSAYAHFESLMSTQYPYDEVHETETKVTENLSLSNAQEAYLFDRKNRELYSGSPTDIQILIKQPNSLAMWAELQGQTLNQTKFESELSEPLPTTDDWALTKALIKLVVVWFGVTVILPVPWASAMHLFQSVASRFPFIHSNESTEKLKAKLTLENQIAELSRQEQALKVLKKAESQCESENLNK